MVQNDKIKPNGTPDTERTCSRLEARRLLRQLDDDWIQVPSDLTPGDAREARVTLLVTHGGHKGENNTKARLAIDDAKGWIFSVHPEVSLEANCSRSGRIFLRKGVHAKASALVSQYDSLLLHVRTYMEKIGNSTRAFSLAPRLSTTSQRCATTHSTPACGRDHGAELYDGGGSNSVTGGGLNAAIWPFIFVIFVYMYFTSG